MEIRKHLKDKQYYIDLYDEYTVEKCRRFENHKMPIPESAKGSPKLEKIADKYADNVVKKILIYAVSGDRYINKRETIDEWMRKDRQRDEMLENAQPIAGVDCFSCNLPMDFVEKELRLGIDEDDKVMFSYRCPKCRRIRLFFDGGREYIPSNLKCPTCQTELKAKHSKDKDKLITFYSCKNCNYKDKIVIGGSKKSTKEKADLNYEKDKKRFCLTDEDGQYYLGWTYKLKHLEFLQKESKRENEVKEKIKHIKKLNADELETLLSKELLKSGFSKFETANPEIGRDVIIHFTVNDTDKNHSGRESEYALKRAIKTILTNTNWHLMADGVLCRLGIISGRLRGYDSDKDLLKSLSGDR